MKKGKIIILIVLSMILVAEGVLYFTSSKSYADISEKLKATAVDEENGTLLNCQNISIDGRNYTQLICQIKKGEVRIISLKTKDRELVIPNRIGSYPVKVVGGSWTEIPEARWMAPSTPPPPSRLSLAALTMASTFMVVISFRTICRGMTTPPHLIVSSYHKRDSLAIEQRMGSGFLDAQHLLKHLKVSGHRMPGHLGPLAMTL